MKSILLIFSFCCLFIVFTSPVSAADVISSFQLAQTPPSCNDANLADFYNVPFPSQNSSTTTSLINCINTNIPNSAMIDAGQIYTYQLNPEKINYTRGNRVCGLDAACGTADCHAVNSCHYGGRTGTEGAEGVDFNANLAGGYTEATLFEAIKLLVFPGGACHGLAKYIILEGDHTHMSTNVDAGCDVTNIPSLGAPTEEAPVAEPETETTPISLPDPLHGTSNESVDVITLILRIIQTALAVLDVFALFMFIFGGFQFLMSAGNQEKIKSAKDTLVWAAIGVLVITFSYAVLKFVFEAIVKGAG